MPENIVISKKQLQSIRELGDFDLKMLLSEINDFGWESAAKYLLPLIQEAVKKENIL